MYGIQQSGCTNRTNAQMIPISEQSTVGSSRLSMVRKEQRFPSWLANWSGNGKYEVVCITISKAITEACKSNDAKCTG